MNDMEPKNGDEYLVNRALSGDAYAFEELTKMYYDSVRFLALSILKEQQEAEDIAQETFLKAYSRLRELRKPSSSFLFNQTFSFRKRKSLDGSER